MATAGTARSDRVAAALGTVSPEFVVRVVAFAMLATQMLLLEQLAWEVGRTFDEPGYLTRAEWQLAGQVSMHPLPLWAYGLAARAVPDHALFAARQTTIAAILVGGAFLF